MEDERASYEWRQCNLVVISKAPAEHNLDANCLNSRRPVMRQQLVDEVVLLCWQSREHVFQVGVRIVPVQTG